ncbi:hypothetical protein FB567DRAFT_518747 [Paraphoma chrysanthemicola]|uniref:DUF6590 domain-containing protein n=1 Tax=Paraphoma chrysanthemicola TaxID=798071 RepID=A0A8K0RAJ3_9PLEO|nr:hypothetical protein FB567DRAFT_518747 [Paraphoma chrysanthemicola]
MATYFTPWTWSDSHQQHYTYRMSHDHKVLETIWSGPTDPSRDNSTPRTSAAPSGLPTLPATTSASSDTGALHNYTTSPPTSSSQGRRILGQPSEDNNTSRVDSPTASPERSVPSLYGPSLNTITSPPSWSRSPVPTNNQYITDPSRSSPHDNAGYNDPSTAQALSIARDQSRSTIASLPHDVQRTMRGLERRFIQSGTDAVDHEQLDPRFRRVSRNHQAYFFTPGRVFKMLWTEPAGLVNPGKTRNSTHFSTVRFGETAFSEIRRFVVVRNKGSFSQCIPVQTYGGRAATKPGLVMSDHGVIYTTAYPPYLLVGEALTKSSIQVETTGGESLEPTSRVNYGKAYAVEHNVKVLDIGMVLENHRYLIAHYFDSAMRGL